MGFGSAGRSNAHLTSPFGRWTRPRVRRPRRLKSAIKLRSTALVPHEMRPCYLGYRRFTGRATPSTAIPLGERRQAAPCEPPAGVAEGAGSRSDMRSYPPMRQNEEGRQRPSLLHRTEHEGGTNPGAPSDAPCEVFDETDDPRSAPSGCVQRRRSRLHSSSPTGSNVDLCPHKGRDRSIRGQHFADRSVHEGREGLRKEPY